MTHVTFEAAILARNLATLAKVIERRSVIPQMHAVLISRKPNGVVTISATDLDMVLTLDIDHASMNCEDFTITLTDLQKLASSADKGALVMIEPSCAVADILAHHVDADGLTGSVDGYSVADFPALTPMGFSPMTAVFSERDLSACLEALMPCVSNEETRYYLKGVYVHATDQSRGALSFAATDGHKLGLVNSAQAMTNNIGAIIPTKAITALLASMDGKSSDPVVLEFSEDCRSRMVFTGPKFTLTARAIDGTFPDYTRVIPKGPFADRATIDHASWDKQTARIAKLYPKAVAILDTGADTITARDPESGKTLDFKHAFKNSGDGVRIGFNMRHLREVFSGALKHLGALSVNLKSAADPALIDIALTDRPSFAAAQFVVMPMRC